MGEERELQRGAAWGGWDNGNGNRGWAVGGVRGNGRQRARGNGRGRRGNHGQGGYYESDQRYSNGRGGYAERDQYWGRNGGYAEFDSWSNNGRGNGRGYGNGYGNGYGYGRGGYGSGYGGYGSGYGGYGSGYGGYGNSHGNKGRGKKNSWWEAVQHTSQGIPSKSSPFSRAQGSIDPEEHTGLVRWASLFRLIPFVVYKNTHHHRQSIPYIF